MNTWFRVLHYFFKAEDFGPEYSSALFCFCCSAQLGAQTLLCHLLSVAQGKAQRFDGFSLLLPIIPLDSTHKTQV